MGKCIWSCLITVKNNPVCKSLFSVFLSIWDCLEKRLSLGHCLVKKIQVLMWNVIQPSFNTESVLLTSLEKSC